MMIISLGVGVGCCLVFGGGCEFEIVLGMYHTPTPKQQDDEDD